MSQHDFDLTTADANTGPTVRAGMNAMAQALATCSSGATEPDTMYAYQFWADTTSGYMKQRNAANNAWLTRWQLSAGQLAALSGFTLTGLANFAAGADIASATTIDLTAATGNSPRITGTTPTSAVTMNTGQQQCVVAAAAWPLVYNATTNRLNTGGANYTCLPGETVLFHKDGSGVVHGNIQYNFLQWAWTKDLSSFGAVVNDVSAAAANSTAIQNAIDSGYNIIAQPGIFYYATGILFDDAITFTGSGSCQDNGQPGPVSTTFDYTGAGIAMSVVGSGVNGKENIHLSNFRLTGTVSAIGGLALGTGVNVSKSSFKNMHIRGFTNPSYGYGVNFQKILSSVFENVYAQSCYDGWTHYADGFSTTSLSVINCKSRSNARYGVLLFGDMHQSDFYSMIVESNADAGLYIYGGTTKGLNFYGLYTENNNTASGVAPIIINGSAVDGKASNINFYAPNITEYGPTIWTPGTAATGTRIRNFYLDYAENISIVDPNFLYYKTNSVGGALTSFVEQTANTANVDITMTDKTRNNSHVQGHTAAGVRVNGAETGTWTAGLVAGTTGTITLSDATCRYTKKGDEVTVGGIIIVDSVAAPVGTLSLTGLPYVVGQAAGATYSLGGSVAVYAKNLTAGDNIVGALVLGDTQISLANFTAGNVAAMAGYVQATTEIYFTATYQTR